MKIVKKVILAALTWLALTIALIIIDNKFSLSEATKLFAFVGLFLPAICAILVLFLVGKKHSSEIEPYFHNNEAFRGDPTDAKCRIGIMREARTGGSASLFTIYVDGARTTTIKNGGVTRLVLAPGRHVIGFSWIGSKIVGSITLDLQSGEDANLICYPKLSRIEVKPTTVDVCSIAESMPQARQQPSGSGCLVLIAIILILFALGILSIRFTVFFVPVR